VIDRGDSKDSLPVIEPRTDTASLHQPSDRWGTRRIWIAGACSAVLAFNPRMIGFLPLGVDGLVWPNGAGGSLQVAIRPLFEILDLIVLPLAFFVVGLLISAGIALWRRHYRRMASSILAIAVIPICYVVIAKAPFLDPWLWYVIANHTRFEALAASNSPASGPEYAVIEIRDVSAGLVINGNHFIALVYDESDAVGLEPSERPSIWRTRTIYSGMPFARGKRLYGHFFKVDEF
jgi:hypothetical protein